MAGGMSQRGAWGSMSDRVQHSQDSSRPPLPSVPTNLKHCWVTDGNGRLPALLLEWRRLDSGFHGRVVRPVSDEGGWLVVEEWLPASMLERA
jgi:hypothetical protein